MVKVELNIESIRVFSNDLKNSSNSIVENLLNIKKEIASLDRSLNTPTGDMLKNRIVDYINNRTKYVEEDVLAFSDKLSNIADIYENEQAYIAASINGGS